MACNCSEQSCTCKNPLKEHLSRIMDKTNYVLSEARYKLADNFQEDESIPEEIWSSKGIEEDEEDIPQEIPSEPTDTEAPAAELPPEEDVEPSPEIPSEPPVGELPPEEVPEEKTADEIQNEIIKTNLAAMQKMNDKVNDLGMALDSINTKLEVINNDVEEVKEPTNVEKLMSKKDDSYPYYYNLNDMWNGNSFQARRQQDNMKGIKKLDDGTYIADFDELPKYTDQEIDKSFKPMKIGHKSGSKERLFEMMERVNKVTLNESFDSPKKKDEKYLDHTVDPKGNQDNKYDDGVRYPAEKSLKVDDESLEGLKGDDAPLTEKWDTDTETPKSERGKYKGKSLEELRSELAAVKKSGPHKEGSPEYEKQNELEFAIRAKTDWGKVNEDEPTQNPLDIPHDENHPLADIMNTEIDDQIEGGFADDAQVSDFDSDQIAKGIKVEMEHTNDPKVALEIAMDHLVENPNYYDELESVEQKEEDKLLKPSEHWVDDYSAMNVNEFDFAGQERAYNDQMDFQQSSFDDIVNAEFVYDQSGNWIPKGFEDKKVAIRQVEQPMGSGNNKFLVVGLDDQGGVTDTYATKDTFDDAKKALADGMT